MNLKEEYQLTFIGNKEQSYALFKDVIEQIKERYKDKAISCQAKQMAIAMALLVVGNDCFMGCLPGIDKERNEMLVAKFNEYLLFIGELVDKIIEERSNAN